MGIVVKGNNDILIFRCKIDNNFENIIQEIEELLDKPLFIQEGYFPKAFFDFGCRYLTEEQVEKLINVIFVKKRVLFYGINLKEDKKNKVNVYSKVIHAGEIIEINEDTLFLNGLNRDAVVFSQNDIYFLGTVKGKIISNNQNIKIYGHNFDKATIKIMNKSLHDLTTFTSSMIYYDNEMIFVEKEEEIWLE